MSRPGLTLLETMVALVILGLVGLGFLELFGGTVRTAENARDWSRAVIHAEAAMERIKLEGVERFVGTARLEDGFRRRVDVRPWGQRLALVHVTVSLSDGRRFELRRLVEER